MKAIIVDDEPHSARYLAELLDRLWPALEIAGFAENGRQALNLAAEFEPDIVFLDIHMPGLSGMEVAEQLVGERQIVFVTAYDQHAVAAFEHNAADYLLKPVSAQRLQQTIAKLQHNTSRPPDIKQALSDLTEEGSKHLQWLKVGIGERTELVSTQDVVYLQADQKYTSVFTSTSEYLIRTPIKDLVEALDPEQFWQIHRGTIVRIAEVTSARRDLRGRYQLTLKSRSEKLRSSQSYSHLFRQM